MPDGVVGHSVGDIAALHESGVLDLREAVRLVWHRGHIMQQATGLGRMASVGLTEAEANEFVGLYGDRLSVGAINGPRSVVLSGKSAALEAALTTLTANGISHRMLPVQYAFHSAQMAGFQDQFVGQLGNVLPHRPRLPCIRQRLAVWRMTCTSMRPISVEMFAIRTIPQLHRCDGRRWL